MKSGRVVSLAVAVLALSLAGAAQTGSAGSPANTPVLACPVELHDLGVYWVNVHVKNTSGKKIVGMVFNAAFSDAAEHWKWLHWDYDDTKPLRNFNWSEPVNAGARRKLEWDWQNLDHEHGGGVVFVLTSVLFEDGSTWDDASDKATCKAVWHANHKHGFTRPIELPSRP